MNVHHRRFPRHFPFQVDILINVLKNLKGNDKFDGMQYLLVSINTIKIKWSPIVSQRAITLKPVDTAITSHLSDQTLSNFFRTKKDNSKLIYNASNLNTLRIAQFIRRTLSEFVFESVNLSSSSNELRRALTDTVDSNDQNESSLISTGINESDEMTLESVTELHQKKVKTKKKQHSTYKCVLCEKRSVHQHRFRFVICIFMSSGKFNFPLENYALIP